MMSFTPDLSNVELEPCCIDSIKDINRILTAGKWLQKVILPLGFFNCFVGPSKGSGLTTVNSIRATDWENLARATISVPGIVKYQIGKIALSETLNHPGGNLNKFWRGIHDAFN